ncbi:hypothetical protein IE81DRAFT_323192 [Ceraceosorus guamensis]|uniref:Uncharacterized protein n=1 Tax=Ceraceosorus guamensis TaxID=1522189 RepID=A0A316VZA6_9BASI|nr:hypothetical protein IE81DRAFT_323192 [Ceraceosorus guamensis]PWN42644.1 hypothetical protein IE81DRAFT_323192 [Ceraceosorus guamensis]
MLTAGAASPLGVNLPAQKLAWKSKQWMMRLPFRKWLAWLQLRTASALDFLLVDLTLGSLNCAAPVWAEEDARAL